MQFYTYNLIYLYLDIHQNKERRSTATSLEDLFIFKAVKHYTNTSVNCYTIK